MSLPNPWRLLQSVAFIYLAVCVLVFLLQRTLMYFPAPAADSAQLAQARASGLEAWRDEGGRLLGWRSRPTAATSPATARVLLFHGNAGAASDRDFYLPALGAPGREVVLFEYPGYGGRPGSPSQSAIVNAAVDALERLWRESPAPVWLLGESLGSAVAAQVAARYPWSPPAAGRRCPAGLILVTPVARMVDVAAAHYSYLPVRLLLSDRWDSVEALSTWRGPVAILIAQQDEVVGAEQGRILARSLQPAPKIWEQTGAGHNSIETSPEATPWPEVRALLDDTSAGRGGPDSEEGARP